ncbi:hypothetical protein RchiOBHm_Chr4g0427181 [Rosa chinensis]|uniref:Uncharacterized protein n=1 Tax=Rosa chinensis TaxID=74649 RepID=A0A2P6QZJ8_ROSCH|nr:hypothetical protein RchiOBHm_Chr4g0427181 [Rosa chinensis]
MEHLLQKGGEDVLPGISQTLYFPNIVNVPLFKGCSTEFINQIEK